MRFGTSSTGITGGKIKGGKRCEMRLFVAIELDDRMKKQLMLVQDDMRAQRVEGKYPEGDNLHMTLAFIGEYPDPDEVLDVLDTISFEPFTIRVNGYGCFDEVIWWAGIESCPPLDAYVKRLRRALAEAGIPYDRKQFRPHITLVRDAIYDEAPVFKTPDAEMEVSFISLMRSDSGKHGMNYSMVSIVEAVE